MGLYPLPPCGLFQGSELPASEANGKFTVNFSHSRLGQGTRDVSHLTGSLRSVLSLAKVSSVVSGVSCGNQQLEPS